MIAGAAGSGGTEIHTAADTQTRDGSSRSWWRPVTRASRPVARRSGVVASRSGARGHDRHAHGRGHGVPRDLRRHAYLIRRLRHTASVSRSHDDGPIEQQHIVKAGTPTMGGIAEGIATSIGYVVAHVRHKTVALSPAGWSLLVLIVGLGAVGFLDDYLGVRGPPEPRSAQARQDTRHPCDRGVVRVARARLRAHVDAPLLSRGRTRPTWARSVGSCSHS